MNKGSLIHISRRKEISWWRAWLVRLAAIALALILCGIITFFATGLNPISFYAAMIDGSFGTSRRIWMLLQNMAILLCISVALAPAFRMRFWNLGGDGQALMGALGAAASMILLGDKVPNWLLILIMTVAAVLFGAVWAFIPAFFKAKWNTNETLFTLMMNYVAVQLVAFFVIIWEVPKGAGKIGIINQNTNAGWFPQVGGSKYLLNVIIAVLITVIMYVYMKYTKHGYEVAVVGESEPTARYAGINVKNVVVRTMVLSGALCGVAGLLLVGGTDHTLTTTLIDGRGFTGVMVAWLAKFNPIYMALTGFLIVFLQRGSAEITTMFTLNQSYGDIITGIILFFVIGCEFFLNYQIHFRKSHKEVA
ncbi:MAG: ABC transporter permease [Eubacteriales bacterium]|nr:ABC transporter permease [Eubacteriales bacterium]